jgi:hypothetical protein
MTLFVPVVLEAVEFLEKRGKFLIFERKTQTIQNYQTVSK